MTLMLSIGRWGGVYFSRGLTIRLCLGWVAFTYIPLDIDDVFNEVL